MNNSFGPWSTAINTGAKQKLNTFWKRRLAMLPTLSQSGSRATRRALVVLGLLAIGALGIPTLKRGTQAQTIVQVIDSAGAAEETGDADKPASAAERSDRPANEPRFRNTLPTVEFLPRLSPDEKKIVAALEKPVTVEFLDVQLEDCITFLKEYTNMNIYIDKAALTDEAVAIDQPATLKLQDIRLESTLKLLLRPVELDFLVEDDILKITTRAAAKKKLMTRTYPVRDLYQGRDQIESGEQPKKPIGKGGTWTPSKYTDLEEAITRNIEPDTWDQLSGPGSLTYVKETGSLVIRQTWSVHRNILQLLRDLREAKRFGQAAPERGAQQTPNVNLRQLRHGERFSIVGIMDMDGDGQGKSGAFREWVGAAGATIDNEVDEQGVLRVNGKVPEDGKARVTTNTKFVVIGKIPEIATAKDAEEKARVQRIFELKADLMNQASKQGVRVVSLRDFLGYIGYKPNSTPADEEEAPATANQR